MISEKQLNVFNVLKNYNNPNNDYVVLTKISREKKENHFEELFRNKVLNQERNELENTITTFPRNNELMKLSA